MARPTKYSQEIVEKAQHYLDNFQQYGEVIPSAVGLALVLDIWRSTLYEWAKAEDKKAFTDILDNINKRQEQILLNNGLNNKFNSNITKLVLGKHGYHDRLEQGNTQVQVIVNRGGVVLKSGDDTLAIEDNQASGGCVAADLVQRYHRLTSAAPRKRNPAAKSPILAAPTLCRAPQCGYDRRIP
jgi:hypothetical protein